MKADTSCPSVSLFLHYPSPKMPRETPLRPAISPTWENETQLPHTCGILHSRPTSVPTQLSERSVQLNSLEIARSRDKGWDSQQMGIRILKGPWFLPTWTPLRNLSTKLHSMHQLKPTPSWPTCTPSILCPFPARAGTHVCHQIACANFWRLFTGTWRWPAQLQDWEKVLNVKCFRVLP
jgi:hypothetical protein